MRQFLSLRYLMTSNVPFEKNKMASMLAASVINTWSVHKMQGGRAPGEILKEKESAVEKKLKKCNQFFLGKLPAGKLFCKFNTTTKRRENRTSSQITVYTSKRIFCPKL